MKQQSVNEYQTCFVLHETNNTTKAQGPFSQNSDEPTINYTKLRYGAYVHGIVHTRDSCNVASATLLSLTRLLAFL